jgi:hypothetical protein
MVKVQEILTESFERKMNILTLLNDGAFLVSCPTPTSCNRPSTYQLQKGVVRALFYMPLYKFLLNLLNVLVQIANKMGLQKKHLSHAMPRHTIPSLWSA